jgi:hypothetical protein
MKKLLLLGAALLSTSSFAEVSAITKTAHMSSKRNALVEIKGEHHINIDNHKWHREAYTYSFTLCAEGTPCDYVEKRVILQPGQNYRDDYTSHILVKFREKGDHWIRGETHCKGGDYLQQESRTIMTVH